jgi:NAD(P)-dependent dehydrogenase (short-subunit alcohol dehydrogenase family)
VLGSVFRSIREVMPYMKMTGMGNIINIASMYGIVVPDFRLYEGECLGSFNPPQYGAAKAGVIQLTKYFAEYLIPFNIRVNAISPGTFPSKSTQKNKEFIRRLSSKNPANRIGVPDDLKGTLVYLASDASKYVIGQNIQVDGGWTLW